MAVAVSTMLRVVFLLPSSSLGSLNSFLSILVLDEWMFDSVWSLVN